MNIRERLKALVKANKKQAQIDMEAVERSKRYMAGVKQAAKIAQASKE